MKTLMQRCARRLKFEGGSANMLRGGDTGVAPGCFSKSLVRWACALRPFVKSEAWDTGASNSVQSLSNATSKW